LDGFRNSIDTLVASMGHPEHHHLLIDLRQATIGPIAEALLVEASSYLHRRGLGRSNKVAVVVDCDDRPRRAQAETLERIAQAMAMQVHSFEDYALALDWLSDRTR
jgi:hypothetical protein